jgi:hypothetical protein
MIRVSLIYLEEDNKSITKNSLGTKSAYHFLNSVKTESTSSSSKSGFGKQSLIALLVGINL